jgi:hypothetical protein
MFAAYSVIGMILSMHYHIGETDGPSRVANAGYVLYSRDPHLAAVGFVWNPLPSFFEIPILLFYHLWPPLLSEGQAGTFMAAGFMAAAVWQVRGIALDRRVPAVWRWIIVAGFALNPMIIEFGGNGMSEAPFVFFLFWATRRLLRWVRDDKSHNLVVAGIALAGAYLTRYEGAAASVAVAIVVTGVTALRRPATDWLTRFKNGLLDAAVLSFPFMVSFVGLAGTSWVLTGAAFPTFSSSYGNSSQVSLGLSGTRSYVLAAGGPIEFSIRDMLYLEPLLPIAILVLLVLAVRRVEVDCLIPISLFGAILAFEMMSQIDGSTFPLFRYFVYVIPLMMVVVILLWPYRGTAAPPVFVEPIPVEAWWGRTVAAAETAFESGLTMLSRKGWLVRYRARVMTRQPSSRSFMLETWAGKALSTLLVLALISPSIVSTWSGTLNPGVNTYAAQIHSLIDPIDFPPTPWVFDDDAYITNYIDALHLPPGSVLMDTYTAWPIWMLSDDKKQFVITSDFDFIPALNDPVAYGVKYILVSPPSANAGADLTNKRYPTLYRTGAGIATLTISVSSKAWLTWRLYKITYPR